MKCTASCAVPPLSTPSGWTRSTPTRTTPESGCFCTTATSPTAPGFRRILEKSQPDEIYNLAAQSHVRVSFDQAEYTADVVATGTLRMLEAVRDY